MRARPFEDETRYPAARCHVSSLADPGNEGAIKALLLRVMDDSTPAGMLLQTFLLASIHAGPSCSGRILNTFIMDLVLGRVGIGAFSVSTRLNIIYFVIDMMQNHFYGLD